VKCSIITLWQSYVVAKKYPEHVELVVGNDLKLVGYYGGRDMVLYN